ncbi:hypothetical protein HanPI659440_Chr10g0396791 [Helianthus annuus]|nr:hypothetical protein HanPI659440_Chr10g0396791 [Helianthus annuus]
MSMVSVRYRPGTSLILAFLPTSTPPLDFIMYITLRCQYNWTRIAILLQLNTFRIIVRHLYLYMFISCA